MYGGIFGWRYNGSLTITNSFWETGKGTNYGLAYPSSNTGTTGVAATTLKTYATTLGDAFTDDPDNRNNRYPILKWELE